MKRHKSTISRELRRNRGERGRRPAQARQQAAVRRRTDNGKRISKHTWAFVDIKLGQLWSPEQGCFHHHPGQFASVGTKQLQNTGQVVLNALFQQDLIVVINDYDKAVIRMQVDATVLYR